MFVSLSAQDPPEINADFGGRIHGPDQGLINAWLAGLHKRREWQDLASKALAGELPPLPFRGGVEKKLKTTSKVGHLWYVAMWHGLRGEDLALATDAELVMVCSRTGVPVLFTMDREKLSQGE